MYKKASENELHEVQELFTQMTGELYSKKEVQKRIDYLDSCQHEDLFIRFEDQEAVGMVGMKSDAYQDEDKKLAEVNVLVVKSDERGKGYGKELLDFAEKKAEQQDCDGVYLVSGFGRNTSAYKLYRNHGYRDLGMQMVKIFN